MRPRVIKLFSITNISLVHSLWDTMYINHESEIGTENTIKILGSWESTPVMITEI